MAVYFLQRKDEMIKAGLSDNPLSRKKQLQHNHGRLIELGFVKGDHITEREIHHRFSHLAIGHEWFKPGKDLLDFIEENASKIPFDDAFDQLWAIEKVNESLRDEIEHLESMLKRYQEWHKRGIESDLSAKPKVMKAS